MMDRNDIDQALFEIRQMALVAISAQDALMGDGTDSGMFQMPEADANMLSFASFDLLARVEALQAAIARSPCPDRQAA